MQPNSPMMAQGQAATTALSQNRVLPNTYLLLALTMVPTVIGAMVGMATSSIVMAHPIIISLVMLAAVIGLQFAIAVSSAPKTGRRSFLHRTGPSQRRG